MMKVTPLIIWLFPLLVRDLGSAFERDVDPPKAPSMTSQPSSSFLAGRQAEGPPTVSPSPTSGPTVSYVPTITMLPTRTASPTAIPTKSSSPTSTVVPGVEPPSTGMPSLTTSPSATSNPSMSPTVTESPTVTAGPTGGSEEAPTSTNDLNIQTPPNGNDCWGNLTEILMDQRQYSFRETNVKRTYVVCPNKLYETGATDQNGVFDPNYHAIFGMRRNVEYRCGADGSSSNNCIIRGIDSFGELAMVGVPDIFVTSCSNVNLPVDGVCDFMVDNFTFRGFTLEATMVSSIFVVAQVGKNVLFDDIILRDAPMWRHILVAKYSTERRRELADGVFGHDELPAELADRWPWNFQISSSAHRGLEEEEDFSLIDFNEYPFELTITNSKFINNSIVQCPRFVTCADPNPNYNFLVSADRTHTSLNIHNSVFENNDFSKPVNGDTLPYGWSHMVALDWNSSITNNTFINNTVTSSLIRVFDNTPDQTVTFADNYVEASTAPADFDDGVDCTFALAGGIIDLQNATCVEADKVGEPVDSTTPTPTSSPTQTIPVTNEPMTYLPTGVPSLNSPSDGVTTRRIPGHVSWSIIGALLLWQMQ